MLPRDKIEFAQKIYKSCPAYGNFLKGKGLKGLRQFPTDYRSIPLTGKKSYIERFPIEKRLKKGQSLGNYYMICTSSGSTGSPTIWPRDYELDKKAIEFNLDMYETLFRVKKRKTLVVVTFGLGAWTAGMLTARLCWEASRNAKLSVVTPGLEKEVALRVIRELGKYFEQTVITGYPPFIIDLVRYGKEKHFDFKKINTKIHYTSARVLEKQRDELVKAVSRNGSRYDILGFYASSEAGIIGIETQETVDVLEYAEKDARFSEALFGNQVPPTFVTYEPRSRYIEEYKGRIILTVDQPVPLVRYDTKDRGGVIDGYFLMKTCKDFGYKCSSSLKDKKFVYVFGRTDAVRLLSDIYIEDIQYCLQNSRYSDKFTGKFRYGLKEAGLRNMLSVIVYTRSGGQLPRRQAKLFKVEFEKNLAKINPDFKMVSSGIKFAFDIKFTSESGKQLKSGKFNYFL
jgi:phenylacetate-CoA ligase